MTLMLHYSTEHNSALIEEKKSHKLCQVTKSLIGSDNSKDLFLNMYYCIPCTHNRIILVGGNINSASDEYNFWSIQSYSLAI